MSAENVAPNPEQLIPQIHEEPHFVFPSNLDETTKTTLVDIYTAMCADPQGHQQSLAEFSKDPLNYRTIPDWYLLTDRGINSYPLHIAFDLDDETTGAIILQMRFTASFAPTPAIVTPMV